MQNRETQFSPWGQYISRRDFLRWASMAGAGVLLPACSPSPEPTRTPTPEKINLDIPGLSIEKYKVTFEEMFVPFWTSWQIQSGVRDNTNWRVSSRCGLSFIGHGPIKLFDDRTYEFYFDGEHGKFYENVFPDRVRGIPNKAEDIDRTILGWPEVWIYWSPKVLCDGKILYNAYSPSYGRSQNPTRHAIVIADIPNSSKTVIKDGENSGPIVAVSANNKLLLSFGYSNSDQKRGSYLIDLNNGRMLLQADIASREPILNKDGSLLYVNSGKREENIGYMYDTTTGIVKDVIIWPTFLTTYEHVASDNLSYIARKLGMFESYRTEPGQWGIMVYTPEGFFVISSPDKSLVPETIGNDGTIYTFDCIFEFKDRTYKLTETTDKKPFEVRISKLKR